MKKIIISSTLFLIFSATHANSSTGEQAIKQIKSWYNNTVNNCGDATKPAFLCSGIILRAVETNQNPLPVDPMPTDITNDGISFSWLRADNNFSRFIYTSQNGYIFYPPKYIPSSKFNNFSFLCAFPMYADSFSRDSNGCGASSTYPQQSRPCNQVGITNADQWITQFDTINTNKYQIQCGWDIRQGQPDIAQRFNENIQSRNLMDSESWAIQNEIRVKKGDIDTDENLPIHSFFYIKDNAEALENARHDQRRYYKLYKKVIPIIEVSMPKIRTNNTDFNYVNDSQAIGSGIAVSESSPVIPIARGNNNDQLWRSNYYAMDALTVKIPVYEGMEEGQSINVTWRGPNSRLDYNETKVVTEVDDTFFTIPRPNVIDATGANVQIAYSVLDSDKNTQNSQITNLSIERQPIRLPIARINLSTRVVNDTQEVNLHWYGSTNHKFGSQKANNSGIVFFDIPQEWIDENRGKNVYLIYSVEITPGERNIFSRVLVVNIN